MVSGCRPAAWRTAMKMDVPKAPWTAAARRRLCPRPRYYFKAAPDRRSPRRFAHFHVQWRAEGSCESVVRFFFAQHGTATLQRRSRDNFSCVAWKRFVLLGTEPMGLD